MDTFIFVFGSSITGVCFYARMIGHALTMVTCSTYLREILLEDPPGAPQECPQGPCRSLRNCSDMCEWDTTKRDMSTSPTRETYELRLGRPIA